MIVDLVWCHVPTGEILDDYARIWRDDGQNIPIDPDAWYVVAVEANGNLILADRRDGRLLLFAPDHSFAGVTPLAGCPTYALLTSDALPDLPTVDRRERRSLARQSRLARGPF